MMPGRHDGDGDRAPNYNIAFTKRGNGHGGSSHSHLVGSELSVSDNALSEFTVLVAGCRGGKTSFLRLLLDTSNVSPNVPPDDIVSVAKFVQGCSSHTTHIRTASIDVDIDLDGPGSYQRLGLNLIDTPALDYQDERAAERVVSDIMHLVEARFVDTMEDPRKIHAAGGFVHLCLYFLDPDQIAPPRIPASAAPTLARVRGNSFSQSAQELDPSSPHNPLFNRPTLPLGDVNAIRRLSTKCNVLPVIAKADTLSNDRLAAVKIAVRRDLAEGGIGFGIFDDPVHRSQAEVLLKNGDYRNGSSSAVNSPPTSPVSPAPRLPYALISPDAYSHSDGVLRSTPSRQQLINQYTPLYSSPPSKLVPGVYTRSFRWGVLDVLDPGHCDFLPLRNAIFHHMNTLQTYTRDYLFTRFQQEYTERLPPRPSLSSVHLPGPPPGALSTRPVLAIDTAGPHSSISRNQSVPVSREMSAGRDLHSVSIGRPLSDISVSASTKGLPSMLSSTLSRDSPDPAKEAKQRAKKIPVACNFCRSRKLKCDGGRPACSQCVKRQNACDYMAQSKRRGGLRTQSDSDSGEDDQNETTPISEAPSHSHSYHHPRRASNAGRMTPMPINLSAGEASTSSSHSRSLFRDNELPHIATLALPERAPPTPLPMSAPPLPPLRSPEQPTRKRALTAPGGKNGRHPSTSGPKVVACNFCRARKTKCDGAHPACSSCVRRSLACNYVNDRDNNNGGDSGGKKSGKRTSTSARPSPPTPPSSQMASAGEDRDDDRYLDEYEMKRGVEHADMRPSKRMRMDR